MPQDVPKSLQEKVFPEFETLQQYSVGPVHPEQHDAWVGPAPQFEQVFSHVMSNSLFLVSVQQISGLPGPHVPGVGTKVLIYEPKPMSHNVLTTGAGADAGVGDLDGDVLWTKSRCEMAEELNGKTIPGLPAADFRGSSRSNDLL